MSTVSLIRCRTYDALAVEVAVKKSIDLLGGISNFVKPGERVLLKPNLLSARLPKQRVTTDPAVVSAVARLVLDAGGIPFIADSPALERFGRVATRTGMQDIGQKLGIDVVELIQPVTVTLPEGATYKKLEIASRALEADKTINLPKLKTHSQMLLTLGVKNMFGTIVAQRKAEWHHMAGVDRDTFAALLLDVYQAVTPALTILDGVWGMEGHGPGNGVPRKLEIIAAAVDAVALDVGICHLLNVPLSSYPLYRVARARGIGETNLQKIIFVGDSTSDFKISNFQVPALDSLNFLPPSLDWFTKRFLVSKPVQADNKCIDCNQCIEICPVEAIKIEAKKIDFDYDKCIRCYCCQEICPNLK